MKKSGFIFVYSNSISLQLFYFFFYVFKCTPLHLELLRHLPHLPEQCQYLVRYLSSLLAALFAYEPLNVSCLLAVDGVLVEFLIRPYFLIEVLRTFVQNDFQELLAQALVDLLYEPLAHALAAFQSVFQIREPRRLLCVLLVQEA